MVHSDNLVPLLSFIVRDREAIALVSSWPFELEVRGLYSVPDVWTVRGRSFVSFRFLETRLHILA